MAADLCVCRLPGRSDPLFRGKPSLGRAVAAGPVAGDRCGPRGLCPPDRRPVGAHRLPLRGPPLGRAGRLRPGRPLVLVGHVHRSAGPRRGGGRAGIPSGGWPPLSPLPCLLCRRGGMGTGQRLAGPPADVDLHPPAADDLPRRHHDRPCCRRVPLSTAGWADPPRPPGGLLERGRAEQRGHRGHALRHGLRRRLLGCARPGPCDQAALDRLSPPRPGFGHGGRPDAVRRQPAQPPHRAALGPAAAPRRRGDHRELRGAQRVDPPLLRGAVPPPGRGGTAADASAERRYDHRPGPAPVLGGDPGPDV